MPATEYERLSDGAHRAVIRAERDARLAGHDVVSTEHLLVALAESDDDVRDRLTVSGVDADALRDRVAEWGHRGDAVDRAVFSPALRRTVQLAGRLATQERSSAILGRHLLGALLEVEDEFVLRVLISLGVDPAVLRRRSGLRPRRGDEALDAGRRRSLLNLLTGR